MVCFSSENFETHLRRPKAIARLVKVADQLKATPVLLIYLRNQVEYVESLYLQLLRMGLDQDASQMIDEVIETSPDHDGQPATDQTDSDSQTPQA